MGKDIFDHFIGNKVMVIGDVMIDKYLTGKIDRISPEAPVPIVSLQSREARLGGAANVTLSIKALEAEPILFSIVGADENGMAIKNLLEASEISSEYLIESKTRKTTVKSRILASNQQILRVDEEDIHTLSQEEESTLLTKIKAYLQAETVAVIIFQDYNKGVLSSTLISEIMGLAKQKNIPTVVDPKKENFWSYQGATCFKPNLKEIREALNWEIGVNEKDLNKVHNQLRSKLGNEISLITLSEHGIYYGSDDIQLQKSTKSRKIADVCGAGDAVIAIVALCIAHRVSAKTLCQLANIAGGQVCEKVGVVPLEKDQLCREFSTEY